MTRKSFNSNLAHKYHQPSISAESPLIFALGNAAPPPVIRGIRAPGCDSSRSAQKVRGFMRTRQRICEIPSFSAIARERQSDNAGLTREFLARGQLLLHRSQENACGIRRHVWSRQRESYSARCCAVFLQEGRTGKSRAQMCVRCEGCREMG